MIEAVLGPTIEVDGLTETLWPAVKLTDTGGYSVRETPDHIGVLGKTRSGAGFTADISSGVPPEDARLTFEIRGSEGWVGLTGGHPYGFQAGDLTLTPNIPFAPPEEVYAHLVRDMHSDTYITPGFEHALHNARLMAGVRRGAERGKRQNVREYIEIFDDPSVTT